MFLNEIEVDQYGSQIMLIKHLVLQQNLLNGLKQNTSMIMNV